MGASKRTAAAVLIIFLLGTSPPAAADSGAQSLPQKEVEAGVLKIARLVGDHYVFSEKGAKIAGHLLSEHARGRFAPARDWQAFSSVATEVLREVSGDGHLYVRYDPQQVKELAAAATPDAAADSGGDNSFFYGASAREKNYGFTEVKVLDGNVGYLRLSEINISGESLHVLFAAMRFVANTRALVIDLRDNGGGGSEIGAVLESFFLPKDVALLEFRSRGGTAEVSKTVSWLTERRYERPLYVVINKKTGSAAEAFAYALQAKKRAVVVGQTSAGAANMNSWYPVNEHVYVSVSTGAPVLPGTQTSWEGKGVRPDYPTSPGEEMEAIKQLVAKT